VSEQKLLKSVQRLASALARMERHAAQRGGVSLSQFRIMLRLEQEGDRGLRVSDLADDQGLAVSTMTRNLALLERKGWVARAPGNDDKRTVRVVLTDVGRETSERLQGEALGRLSKAFRTFHPTDRVERAAALDRVAAAIETDGDDA
jgi:MarR family transcriptional regulator, organic hydroperoxide resistance regulator